jgi:hypothetical protein
MIAMIIALCLVGGGAFLYRHEKGSHSLKTASVLLMLAGCFLLGWQAATWKERVKLHEEYIWRFSRYSVMLRSLAERHEIEALTNAVILFDQRFNPRKDPQDLADVLQEILDTDPAWSTVESNASQEIKQLPAP